jgi:membrane-bound lytic murein transglycosylase D
MQPHGKALLIAVALFFFYSSLLSAADRAPAETAAQATLTADIPPLGTWPISPPSRPFDKELGPEDISSVQVPAAGAPQMPAMMDLTTSPISLWTRIRLGFALPDVASALVREQEEWFANRPEYIKRTVARSSRYLHYIVEALQKRGMPSEIALLPIIESAYNPVAYSRAHASGIWQFIPSTGRSFGLQQNFWYDGRRDVMAATNAALDYLQKLYDMFGSWDLALAAYNWGEGAVGRAIAKNTAMGLATDYQSLTMPQETRYYLPKLQAVKNIIANPAQFGIELAEVPNQPYFVAVPTNKNIDIKLAAKLAGVPLEEFQSLNPAHSRPVIRADSAFSLLLPADKADTFRANLESNSQPLVSWQTYTLRSGDTLGRVATRHGISVAQLKQLNDISAHERIGPGSTLLVPASGNATQHLPNLRSPSVSPAKASVASAKAPKKSLQHASRKSGFMKAAHAAKKPAATSVRKTAARSTKKIVLAQKLR